MVNLSSEETCGPFAANMVDEGHPNRPIKPYGVSNYAVERLTADDAAPMGSNAYTRGFAGSTGRACRAHAC